MHKKYAISGKKFGDFDDGFLLDKIPKLWYNGNSGLVVRLRPGQIDTLWEFNTLHR